MLTVFPECGLLQCCPCLSIPIRSGEDSWAAKSEERSHLHKECQSLIWYGFLISEKSTVYHHICWRQETTMISMSHFCCGARISKSLKKTKCSGGSGCWPHLGLVAWRAQGKGILPLLCSSQVQTRGCAGGWEAINRPTHGSGPRVGGLLVAHIHECLLFPPWVQITPN